MSDVFISAGHGGGDPGALSLGGYTEAEMAVWLRDEVAAILRGRMVRVITDGDKGENEPLRDALVLMKTVKGPAIEIHFNASGSELSNGVEVLAKPEHKPLAQELARAISTVTKSSMRGQLGWKNQDEGQHHRLAFCQLGGLIVEVCFITNRKDFTSYLNERGRVAEAIANVLERAARK